MDEIVVQFDVDDAELRDAIRAEFGDAVQFLEVRSFDGMKDVAEAVLPYIPVLITFLTRYFTAPKKTSEKRRFVITRGGQISLEGYSEKEILRILGEMKLQQ